MADLASRRGSFPLYVPIRLSNKIMRKGFTLIELLVFIAIICILVLVVIAVIAAKEGNSSQDNLSNCYEQCKIQYGKGVR